MKPKPPSFRSGMSLIEVLVVIAVVMTVAALLLPMAASARRKSRRMACVDNLKQLELAFKTWGVDGSDYVPMQVSVTNGGSMEYIGSGHTFPHFQAMSNELTVPKLLVCPDDKTRTIAKNFQSDLNDSKTSYFVGVDVNAESFLGFLFGDSHIAISGVPVKAGLLSLKTNDVVGWTSARHLGEGNVGLADGSVQQTTTSHLQKLLAETGVATNRLSIP